MIQQFNVWFFGNGGYEFLGGFLEICLVMVLGAVAAGFVASQIQGR